MWDDLYDDSWGLYKKIGNTILPVYVGADAGSTTDTKIPRLNGARHCRETCTQVLHLLY